MENNNNQLRKSKYKWVRVNNQPSKLMHGILPQRQEAEKQGNKGAAEHMDIRCSLASEAGHLRMVPQKG